MSIDLSNITYGAVIGPGDGVTISKITYGAVIGPDPGINISKITYGVIIDSLTPEVTGRRRQAIVM